MTHIRKTTVVAPKQAAKSFLDFKVKVLGEQKAGAVAIEGWANPSTVDRGGEVVDPAHWDLEDFKKNPVLLYNHGKDPNYGMIPIGRVTDISADENGLYAKAVLSNADDPKIKLLRDLTSEGMLRTFSVGFNPGQETANQDGSIGVAGGKLMELSIVTIPMHQDAIFALSSKDISSKDFASMKSKLTDAALKTKGAYVASALENRIGQQLQEVANFDRDAALTAIATAAGTDMSEIKNVLSGETLDVPAKILKAFADALGLDLAELKKLNEGDTSMADKKPVGGAQQPGASSKAAPPPMRTDSPVTWATDAERAPKPVETIPDANDTPLPAAGPGVVTDEKKVPPAPGTPAAAATAPDPAAAAAATPPAPPAAPAQKVQAIIVPHGDYDQEGAASMVSENGWDSSRMNSDDEAGEFVFVQEDPESFQTDSMSRIDLGNGCMAQVGKPVAAAAPAAKAEPTPEAPKPDPKTKSAETEVADTQTPQPAPATTPAPAAGDNKPEPKVEPGHAACAACIAKHMKDGMAAGHTHSDNKAIALSKCKTECPTTKSDDMPEGTKPFAPEQLEAFADGYQTAHDHIKAGAVGAVESAKAAEPAKTKQAGQVPGASTPIPGGGDQSPDAGLDQNPFLETARQTNVLLGTLISKFDELSQKLDGLVSSSTEAAADSQIMENVAKSLESGQNTLNALQIEIRKLKANYLGA